MFAHTQESPQFDLSFDQTHSRSGFTYLLSFTAPQYRSRRKLAELKDALHKAGYSRLGIEAIDFPAGQRHQLAIRTTTRARRKKTPQELETELFNLIAPFVTDAIARVDHDLAVITPTDVVSFPQVITPTGRKKKTIHPPHTRKQHCTERTLTRRQRRREERNLETARAAFADADLPPVIFTRRLRSAALA